MSATAPQPHRWTRDEYARMVAAGVFGEDDRVELIEGEIVEMSPENSRHAATIDLVSDALRRVFGTGFTIRVQHPISLGGRSEPEPDVAVVTGTARTYAAAHPTTAALVVEVADTSRDYDRTTKSLMYAQAGLAEYWIVNVVDGRLEVYRGPGPTGFASRRDLGPGESVSPVAAPGASIPVSDLLP